VFRETLNRPIRKRFERNTYTVTDVMDVWECDLLDVKAYAKYKHNHRYNLTVIDVFSKFLYLIPMKTKNGPFVTSAFRSILDDDPNSLRRPVCVRTNKGKEFLNKYFQDMLRDKGIQLHVCKNPDVKHAVVERTQCTIRNKFVRA